MPPSCHTCQVRSVGFRICPGVRSPLATRTDFCTGGGGIGAASASTVRCCTSQERTSIAVLPASRMATTNRISVRARIGPASAEVGRDRHDQRGAGNSNAVRHRHPPRGTGRRRCKDGAQRQRRRDMRIIATLALGRSPYGLSLPLIFGLGVYALIAGHGGAVLHDPDTYLHITVGRWIIAHGAVPHHGIFSGTMAQAPWVAHEWLGEALLAWLFDTFGWAGLVAATAFCAAAAVGILLLQLLRSLVPVHAMIATALAVTLVIPHVLARPHVFTLPILVAWAAGLVRARCENRAPAAWLAVLMAL